MFANEMRRGVRSGGFWNDGGLVKMESSLLLVGLWLRGEGSKYGGKEGGM